MEYNYTILSTCLTLPSHPCQTSTAGLIAIVARWRPPEIWLGTTPTSPWLQGWQSRGNSLQLGTEAWSLYSHFKRGEDWPTQKVLIESVLVLKFIGIIGPRLWKFENDSTLRWFLCIHLQAWAHNCRRMGRNDCLGPEHHGIQCNMF